MHSVKTLAKELNISPNTIKDWEKKFNIHLAKNSDGKIKNDQEALTVLKTIKQMRDAGSGFKTITRIITDQTGSDPSRSELIPNRPNTDQSTNSQITMDQFGSDPDRS